MEDYDEFVSRRVSQLKRSREKSEAKGRPPPASSLIRFRGLAILPPLLSREQREEMRRTREAVFKRLKETPKMSLVQNILSNVQVTKAPTLEDMLQECEITTEPPSSRPSTVSSESSSTIFAETPESVLPARARKSLSSASSPRLTPSQTFFTPEVSPRQSHDEERLSDPSETPDASQSYSSCSGESSSLDFAVHERVGNDTRAFRLIDREGCVVDSSQEPFTSGGFVLHSTSKPMAACPDIISHPPVDGQELELSGVQDSVCGETHIYDSSYHDNDDVVRERLDSESREGIKDVDVDIEDGPPSLELCDLPPAQTPSSCSTADEKDSVEDYQAGQSRMCNPAPHPRSLQALLKMSQEYRRQQRMLRNQSRNSKTPEERPKKAIVECSLSDKENDEFPPQGTGTEEGSANTEKREASTPPKETSQTSRIIRKDASKKETSIKADVMLTVGSSNDSKLDSDAKTALKNKLNSSSEAVAESQSSSSLQQQQQQSVPSETSPVLQKAPASKAGAGRYRSVPAPSFCHSPVQYKSNSRHLLTGEVSSESAVAPADTGRPPDLDVTTALGENSQHIDQLETNLSSLKSLILDLESTVKENLESPAEKDTNPEGTKQLLNKSSLNFQAGQSSRERSEDERGDLAGEADDPHLTVQETKALVGQSSATEREKENGKGCAQRGSSRIPPVQSKSILSAAQHKRIPSAFRSAPAASPAALGGVLVLSDTSNRPTRRDGEAPAAAPRSENSPFINQSYSVDKPSGLWLQPEPESEPEAQIRQRTPGGGADDHGRKPGVKRRLLMLEVEAKPLHSPPAAPACRTKSRDEVKERMKQVHAAQVRALQEEHRQEQERLLQALTARYRLLQNMSMPTARPGDTLTFSKSQPLGSLLLHQRRLLSATIRGFLTRRLLRTERVSQMVRTIKDTRQFLQSFQQQSRGEICGRQDVLLQKRVTLQLRAARYELHDVFFKLSARERMQLISWDRELAREREMRRQNLFSARRRGKSSLSAATQKSLERKRGSMIQKKAEWSAQKSEQLQRKRAQIRTYP